MIISIQSFGYVERVSEGVKNNLHTFCMYVRTYVRISTIQLNAGGSTQHNNNRQMTCTKPHIFAKLRLIILFYFYFHCRTHTVFGSVYFIRISDAWIWSRILCRICLAKWYLSKWCFYIPRFFLYSIGEWSCVTPVFHNIL